MRFLMFNLQCKRCISMAWHSIGRTTLRTRCSWFLGTVCNLVSIIITSFHSSSYFHVLLIVTITATDVALLAYAVSIGVDLLKPLKPSVLPWYDLAKVCRAVSQRRKCAHKHAHTHEYIHSHTISDTRTCMCTQVHTQTYKHRHAHMHAHTSTYTNTQSQTRAHACAQKYTYNALENADKWASTWMHTQTHNHTHTHTQRTRCVYRKYEPRRHLMLSLYFLLHADVTRQPSGMLPCILMRAVSSSLTFTRNPTRWHR